ncbi:MAG: hypothetical protein IPG18_17280, partial [Saprospiraceae bacterium]|nr:hypothetical protein [Saprospiraceae bacterium]
LSDFNLDNARYNNDSRGSINHRAETKYQYDFDSLLTAIATADVAIVNTSNEQNGSNTLLKNSQTLTSSSMFNNSSDLAGRLLNTSFLLRKNSKKRAGLSALMFHTSKQIFRMISSDFQTTFFIMKEEVLTVV